MGANERPSGWLNYQPAISWSHRNPLSSTRLTLEEGLTVTVTLKNPHEVDSLCHLPPSVFLLFSATHHLANTHITAILNPKIALAMYVSPKHVNRTKSLPSNHSHVNRLRIHLNNCHPKSQNSLSYIRLLLC